MKMNANMEINKKLGKKVLNTRKQCNLTQEAFANDIGMSLCYYRKIEQGKVNISVYSLERIANGFGMEPHKLLEFDDID